MAMQLYPHVTLLWIYPMANGLFNLDPNKESSGERKEIQNTQTFLCDTCIGDKL